jgi:hypothetical protein
VEIWSNTSPATLSVITKKQKQAIRTITNSRYNAHTEPLFKKLQILPFHNLVTYFNLKMMHSYTNNIIPEAFSNTWISNAAQRTQRVEGRAGVVVDFPMMRNMINDPNIEPNFYLRNDNDYHIPFCRTDYLRRFPFFNFPRIWNELPMETKILVPKNQFLGKVKQFFLNTLRENNYCTRLLCPVCHLRV